MNNIFLVLGYGLPKNIFRDGNYNLYFRSVFNRIYDLTAQRQEVSPVIIFSGGPTDCFRPYRRTEAGEKIKFFQSLKQRKILVGRTKKWRLIGEGRSLSTLDNFLFTKKIIQRQKTKSVKIYIFCEQTRTNRVKVLAKKVFRMASEVIPIDFDQSSNRYLDPQFISQKEKKVLAFDLWALKSLANLKKHHQLFVQRIKFLRQAGPARHQAAVREWWEKVISNR